MHVFWLSVSVSGLSPGAQYTFSVYAENGVTAGRGIARHADGRRRHGTAGASQQ